MTELQGHEDRLEISADSSVFVRSREEGSHGRSRVGGSAPPLCQRAGCYQSHPWDLHTRSAGLPVRYRAEPAAHHASLMDPAPPRARTAGGSDARTDHLRKTETGNLGRLRSGL